jgi:hypothetical protein
MTSDFLAQASSTEKSRVENINVKTQQCTLCASFFTIDIDSGGLSLNSVWKNVKQCTLCAVLILTSCLWTVQWSEMNVKLKCAHFDITCQANSTYTLKLYLFQIKTWNLKLLTNFYKPDINPFSWYIFTFLGGPQIIGQRAACGLRATSCTALV